MSNINVIIIVLIEYMIHHSYLNTIAFNILIAYSITIAYYNINTPIVQQARTRRPELFAQYPNMPAHRFYAFFTP